jgi:hypothetical protein
MVKRFLRIFAVAILAAAHSGAASSNEFAAPSQNLLFQPGTLCTSGRTDRTGAQRRSRAVGMRDRYNCTLASVGAPRVAIT